MKLLAVSTLAGLFVTFQASAQWVVEDPAVLAQTIINTYLAKDQLDAFHLIHRQLGDAGTLNQVAGAANVLQSLSSNPATATADATGACTGKGAMLYDGNHLYRVIGESISKPDGTTLQRDAELYRKFDAAHQTAAKFLSVLQDTEARRNAVLEGIRATTEAVQQADSLAAVQKLQTVASAQIAALNAIDGERSAALGCALVQSLDNGTDDATQEQARREDRAVDFSTATDTFARLLTPITSSPPIPRSSHR